MTPPVGVPAPPRRTVGRLWGAFVTRATVGELAELMARHGDTVDAHVVFVRPPDLDAAAARTAIVDEAVRISGVRVSIDDGGVRASRFGARTSGETLLYSAGGKLVFAGGLTSARGHAGDSAGRAALEAQLSRIREGRAAVLATSQVFGCSLLGPEVPAGEGMEGK